MAKFNFLKNNFSIGEISPYLMGAANTPTYANGAEEMENCFPLIGGGVKSRPGLVYSASTKDSTKKSILIPFVASTTVAYVPEFGENYIRFFKDGVPVLSGGSPYEVATPYLAASIQKLAYIQDNDVLYLLHPDFVTSKLTYTSATSWAFSTDLFDVPPDLGGADVTTNTITLSAATVGTGRTATAASAVFASGDVGRYIFGTGGILKITAFTSTTVVTVTILQAFTSTSVTTWHWQTDNGYPRAGTIFQQRLVLGGTYALPQTVWISKTGNKRDFTVGDLDDDGMRLTVASDTTSPIVSMTSGKAITCFTYMSEITIEGGNDAPLTPTNRKIATRSDFGSAPDVRPVKIGPEIIFAQRGNSRIRSFEFRFEKDGYDATDLTAIGSHIAADGGGIVQMAYSAEPYRLLWCIRADGVIATLSYEKTAGLAGWARHVTDGLFESVAVIPFGSIDQVWCIVKRGNTRTVEIFDYEFNTDSAVYDTAAPAAATWTGLSHLNGKSVDILADKSVQPQQTVSGGSLTLTRAASEVEIGLPFDITLKDLPIEVQAFGTLQSSRVAIHEAGVRVYDTKTFIVNGQEIAARQFGLDSLDAPATAFTGIKTVPIVQGWNSNGQVVITSNKPLPVTVLAVIKKVSAND